MNNFWLPQNLRAYCWLETLRDDVNSQFTDTRYIICIICCTLTIKLEKKTLLRKSYRREKTFTGLYCICQKCGLMQFQPMFVQGSTVLRSQNIHDHNKVLIILPTMFYMLDLHELISSSEQLSEAGASMIPILQMRKVRQREEKSFVSVHTARNDAART